MMLSNVLDNAIGFLSPRWAANRMVHRARIASLKNAANVHRSMQQLMAGRNGGYEAGKTDRLKGRIVGSPHENDVPRAQIHALRYRSWNLYRNNPQARKIRRTLNAKVIGPGLMPQPQATRPDGTPYLEFNRRARQVFAEFSKESDWRGKPGSGGQSFPTQCKTAFGQNMLAGGVLYQFHHLQPSEQKKLGLYVPLQIQLIHIDRLDESQTGSEWFYGVHVPGDGRVAGYQILKNSGSGSQYVDVSKMRHLFAEEDVDQIIGSPWFGAALLTMDDRRNYEYSELTAAEMAACVVGTYRLSPGQSQFGLQTNDSTDLTDSHGNPVSHLQPAMMLNLGAAGEFDIKSSNRPNNGASEFLSHLIRSEAVSMPGVKSSTLTGDYRNSSFSSERSADNDIWPEIEELQDWFAAGFCQPIYEEVIKAAVIAGLFDAVPGFSSAEFANRQREYLAVHWQGPVARSINPKDDADAARVRIRNGTSSPQRECQKLGVDHLEILQEQAQHIKEAKALELPDDIWQQNLGIEQTDQSASATTQQTTPATNHVRNFSFQNCA